jgi:fructokinase
MADVSNPSEIRYDIVYPSAWDFIEVTPAAQAWVSAAEVMVFGSLVARSSVSASSLLRLVDAARYPVLDINLRAPHYTREILEQLMSRARMVKLNEHELALIASWYTDENDDRIQMAVLQEKYKWDTLCVTLGGDGAWLRTKSTLYRQTGFKVTVADTIGSGDSFLAALLHHRLAGKPDHEALRFACGVGALIASRKGATPDWTQEDVYALIRSQQGDPV